MVKILKTSITMTSGNTVVLKRPRLLLLEDGSCVCLHYCVKNNLKLTRLPAFLPRGGTVNFVYDSNYYEVFNKRLR